MFRGNGLTAAQRIGTAIVRYLWKKEDVSADVILSFKKGKGKKGRKKEQWIVCNMRKPKRQTR